MPSPFPGIDPYLESQHYWQDFHATFLVNWRNALLADLPDQYEARIEEQVEILELDSEKARLTRSDIAIVHDSMIDPGPSREVGSTGAATLQAVTIPIPETQEVMRRWINILHRPERRIVAVLELLSPTNKTNSGRGLYLGKRSALHNEEVHLVELDLLLGGKRLPMGRPLPTGDFFAIVARWESRPKADVYAWTLGDALPAIPMPLLKPDKDVFVDLGAVYAATFEHGRYRRSIKYSEPLELSLDEPKRQWVEATGRAAIGS